MQLTNVQRDSVFTVRWGGSDNQSGVRTYDVFASVDGGEFFRWLSGTRDTTGTWVGSNNSSYEFFSLATDATGNREAMKFDADASTYVLVSNEPDAVSEVPTEVSLEAAYPNPFTGSTNIGYSVVESGPVLLAVFDEEILDSDPAPRGPLAQCYRRAERNQRGRCVADRRAIGDIAADRSHVADLLPPDPPPESRQLRYALIDERQEFRISHARAKRHRAFAFNPFM